MKRRGNAYASVWDALVDSPEQAANLRTRADLMRQLAEMIERSESAEEKGVSRCQCTTLIPPSLQR